MTYRNPRTIKIITGWTDKDRDEADYDVECNFTPGRPAKLYGPPEDCYEAEPPEIEILKVTDASNNIRKDIQDYILENKAAYDQFLENAVLTAEETMGSENDYED